MVVRRISHCVLALALACPLPASAQASGALTLGAALQRAAATNPRLSAADRDIGIASGRRIQAGAIPNPEVSVEFDNVLGSGAYRGLDSAETTLQLSQLIELGGKRGSRVAAGAAEVDSARWQRAALRLEVLSETAIAFFNVLAGQHRLRIYDAQVAALDKLTPLLQRRVDAGASSPSEVLRSQIAANLVKADGERARTALSIARRELAAAMGATGADFSTVAGDLGRVGRPPAFATLLQALERNPQLVRWTAIRAQRDAELIAARLKPMPDIRVGVGWRHHRDTNDNAVRFGLSAALPVWDQNRGGIIEAQEALAKTEAERKASKSALVLTLGRAYDTLAGALREAELLRATILPDARKAVETIEGGYEQGRFNLLEVLDIQSTRTQADLRQVEALLNFHTSVATIEGLAGAAVGLSREAKK